MDAKEARLAFQLSPSNKTVEIGWLLGATGVAELKWTFLSMGPNMCVSMWTLKWGGGTGTLKYSHNILT